MILPPEAGQVVLLSLKKYSVADSSTGAVGRTASIPITNS